MSQLAKRARHPSQLLELPVTKTTLLNTPFQLTTPIDTRPGIPQGDAVANSAVVEEKLIGGSRPNVACLPSKNIIHSAKLKASRRASTFGFENRVDLWIRPAAQERIERVPSENVYLDAPSGQY